MRPSPARHTAGDGLFRDIESFAEAIHAVRRVGCRTKQARRKCVVPETRRSSRRDPPKPATVPRHGQSLSHICRMCRRTHQLSGMYRLKTRHPGSIRPLAKRRKARLKRASDGVVEPATEVLQSYRLLPAPAQGRPWAVPVRFAPDETSRVESWGGTASEDAAGERRISSGRNRVPSTA